MLHLVRHEHLFEDSRDAAARSNMEVPEDKDKLGIAETAKCVLVTAEGAKNYRHRLYTNKNENEKEVKRRAPGEAQGGRKYEQVEEIAAGGGNLGGLSRRNLSNV